MRSRIEAPAPIARDTTRYPAGLEKLGGDAPAAIEMVGNEALAGGSGLALFCSVQAPGRIVVETYDLARALAAAGETVIGGFQSPLEREVLFYLLRGAGKVILCPARGLRHLSLPRLWRSALEESRLLLVSAFPGDLRRTTAASAEFRNRVAAALSSRVLILHATSGGRLSRLAREVSGWDVPLHCLSHPANEDLRVLGATPLPSGSYPPI